MVNWARGTAATLPDYALRSLIMRETGWDYWTYMAQPERVIEQFLMFLNSETQGQKMATPPGGKQ